MQKGSKLYLTEKLIIKTFKQIATLIYTKNKKTKLLKLIVC